jgi:outer membrane protein OmpA-like peptidoglycan-associated protein
VHVVDDRIEYGEVILFETDRAEVEEGAWPMLRNLAKFMGQNPQIEEVEITGHADERGSEDHNLHLSVARAEAVRSILVSFGVESTRLTAKGFGFRRPRAQGHTEDDWRQNRRVEFRISKLRNGQAPSTATPGQPGVHP